MIELLGGLGYALWIILGSATVAVVIDKTNEGNPTASENELILKSTEHRGNSFLTTDRAVSKWGKE